MGVWLLLMDGCGLSIGLDGEHGLDYWQDGARGSLLVVLWSSRYLRVYTVAGCMRPQQMRDRLAAESIEERGEAASDEQFSEGETSCRDC